MRRSELAVLPRAPLAATRATRKGEERPVVLASTRCSGAEPGFRGNRRRQPDGAGPVRERPFVPVGPAAGSVPNVDDGY